LVLEFHNFTSPVFVTCV